MKKLFTSLLSCLLIVGILSVQVAGASGFSNTTSTTNESGTYVIPTEDGSTLEVSIEETDKEYIVTSYVNGEKESQTIKNKETRDMMTIDNDGKVEYSNESDYIEKIAPDPMISNKESFATNAASNWTFVDSAYNSNPNVKQWGYLYKQEKITFGETHNLNYDKGTKVSVIVGVIIGLITVGTGGIVVAILVALGSTIVADKITKAITGQVYGRFAAQDLEVRSNGKIGLRSKRTIVDAKVINTKNGKVEWVPIRVEGEGRSNTDLCIIGAYNAWLLN
ncbi:hypothetical protein [Paenibacillus sp. Z3-2]